MFKIYGIPNCDSVKKARTFLEEKSLHYDFVDFKKSSPTKEDIERWEKAYGSLPVNTKGVTYKKLKEVYESLSRESKIEFIQKNTSLIKRPILEKNGKVMALGFENDHYLSLFK